MKANQLKELIRQVVKEENDYQEMFKVMLDKTGKSIESMSDTEKKAFFNAVDKASKAKSEGRLRGYNEAELTAGQKKIDTDKDGEIEGSDLKTQINKIVDKSDGKLETTEIENQLKTIFIKSWMDKGITNTAIEKVKKDIK
jgi:hypothetical protein